MGGIILFNPIKVVTEPVILFIGNFISSPIFALGISFNIFAEEKKEKDDLKFDLGFTRNDNVNRWPLYQRKRSREDGKKNVEIDEDSIDELIDKFINCFLR